MKQVKEHALKIIPLGGLGTIGNNMTVFEYGEEIIIVDCGIMFPTEDMPGIDFVIPDFSYVVKNKNRVKAILITHGHEDHIGAIPFLLQAIRAPQGLPSGSSRAGLASGRPGRNRFSSRCVRVRR
jgi:ribonuclease J